MNLRDAKLCDPECFHEPEYYLVEEICPDCDGTGLIPEEQSGEVVTPDCPTCEGTGYVCRDIRDKPERRREP